MPHKKNIGTKKKKKNNEHHGIFQTKKNTKKENCV